MIIQAIAILIAYFETAQAWRQTYVTMQTVYDWIEVFPSKQQAAEGDAILQDNLIPFVFEKAYTNNVTAEGQLCFVEDVSQLHDTCFCPQRSAASKKAQECLYHDDDEEWRPVSTPISPAFPQTWYEDSSSTSSEKQTSSPASSGRLPPWIIMLPEAEVKTSFFKQYVMSDKYNITGLIIVSKRPVDSRKMFIKPSLISIMKWEVAHRVVEVLKDNPTVYVKVRHEYDTICGSHRNERPLASSNQEFQAEPFSSETPIGSFIDLLRILGLVYAWVGFLWIFLTHTRYEAESNALQRGLLTLILQKVLLCSIQVIYLQQCPWENYLQARYVLMALVTITTIYQAVHIAIIILLAKGWLFVKSVLTKDDLSSLSLIMGLVYLSYSALFVTANLAKLQVVATLWMNILWGCVGIYVLVQCSDTKSQIECQLRVFDLHQGRGRHHLPRSPLLRCISLRLSIMTRFMFISGTFYLNQYIVDGILPMTNTLHVVSKMINPNDEYLQQFNVHVAFRQELLEMLYLFAILIIFRPRQWPEFFESSLIEGDILTTEQQVDMLYRNQPALHHALLHRSQYELVFGGEELRHQQYYSRSTIKAPILECQLTNDAVVRPSLALANYQAHGSRRQILQGPSPDQERPRSLWNSLRQRLRLRSAVNSDDGYQRAVDCESSASSISASRAYIIANPNPLSVTACREIALLELPQSSLETAQESAQDEEQKGGEEGALPPTTPIAPSYEAPSDLPSVLNGGLLEDVHYRNVIPMEAANSSSNGTEEYTQVEDQAGYARRQQQTRNGILSSLQLASVSRKTETQKLRDAFRLLGGGNQ